MSPIITVITPTLRPPSLAYLIKSLSEQELPIHHLILSHTELQTPISAQIPLDELTIKEEKYTSEVFCLNDFCYDNSRIYFPKLQAVGLMIANTDYVTFADDNTMWEKNHLATMLESIKNNKWVFCNRNLWKKVENEFEYTGTDDFQENGELKVDNNCIIFQRRFGSSAATLFRESKDNTDTLMYNFLSKYACEGSKSNLATINQVL